MTDTNNGGGGVRLSGNPFGTGLSEPRLVKALQPHPSQQAGTEGARERIAIMLHAQFGRITESWSRAPQETWMKKADAILAALSPKTGEG